MILPIGFLIYFTLSFLLFLVLRCIVALLLNQTIKKRAILITVILGIFHSIICGFISFFMIMRQNYTPHHFLCGFTAAYFVCDLLQLIFLCESNNNNRFAMIHHICGIICIGMSLISPVSFPVDLGIYIVVSELTMPSINLQWIIDTYWGKQKYEGFYKLLLIFNLVVYFVYRILITYYGFLMMIQRRLVLQIISTIPFVVFNTVWFSMLIKKFKGSSLEIL